MLVEGEVTMQTTQGANFIPIAAKQNHAHGKVNHVAVEEAQEAPDVVIDPHLPMEPTLFLLLPSRTMLMGKSTM
jgi:hypothetical protein